MENFEQMTLDQLTDFSFLYKLYVDTDEKDRIKLKCDLKDKSKELGLSIRDFNKLYKDIEEEYKKELSKPKDAIININDLPTCIKMIPENYAIGDDGIWYLGGFFPTQVCSHPIFPIEILKDIETGVEKIRLAYKRHNSWNTDLTISKYDASTKKGIVKLSDYGVMANDCNADLIVKYLSRIESLNENSIPVKRSTSTLGFSKYGAIPYSLDVVCSCTNEDSKSRFELYKENGSKEKWLEWQIKCFNYTVPKIVIAGAYASLILDKLGINPFGIHLWGETGKGKSVSILASASVYGYPDVKKGIVYTGNATNNGLESRLAFVNNYTFYIDELSMLSQSQIDDMIYLIMQGQGKARMTKSATSQKTYHWNCVSVSNSEMPITNDQSKGGIFNRMIQLTTDNGNLFGDLNLCEIADVFKENYGFGAKMFIDLLNDENIIDEIKSLKKKYYDDVIQYTEDKQANSCSCILTAYEIARKYIYKTDKKLLAAELIPYLSTKDEISQVMRTYKSFINYVESNSEMFVSSLELNKGQTAWGSLKDENEIHILVGRFKEFCDKERINYKQFLIGLKDKGLIVCKNDDFTSVEKLDGISKRCIIIKKTSTGKSNRSLISSTSSSEQLIDDLDLPF